MEKPGTVAYTEDSVFEDLESPTEYSLYDLICVYSEKTEIYFE